MELDFGTETNQFIGDIVGLQATFPNCYDNSRTYR